MQLEPVVLERAARLVAWGIERGAKGPHTTEDQRRLAQFLALTDTVRACLQTALQAVEKGDAHAAQCEIDTARDFNKALLVAVADGMQTVALSLPVKP